MIKLLKRNYNGVCEYVVSSEEELNSLNKMSMASTSTVQLIDDNEFRMFILNAERTKWVEL